mgnify:FL=1
MTSITRAGLTGTEVDGIFFSEQGTPAGISVVQEISVHKNRQNFDLTKIKQMMAMEAKAVGANSILNFRYGQRSHKWYQQIALKWDQGEWYGEGSAVYLEPDI